MAQDSSGHSNRNIKAENQQLVLELLAKFNKDIPNEDAGLERLYEIARQCGRLKCPRCVDSDIEKLTHRLIKCRRCDQRIHITAGTFFHGIRLVRPYLAALYFQEHGAVFSAPWFANLFNIATSSGSCILKKIGLVINSQMVDESPIAHSKSFIELLCRRSQKTPADKHPRNELDALEPMPAANSTAVNNSNSKNSTSCVQNTTQPMSEQEKLVFDLLSSTPINFDNLSDSSNMDAAELASILTLLEINGLVVTMPGNRFSRSTTDVSKTSAHKEASNDADMEGILSAVHETVKQIHGGLSRKCLQIYTALFWVHIDRIHWGSGELLKACFKHPRIRYADLLDYVSPPFIKLLPQLQ